jgi:hypothetical protein
VVTIVAESKTDKTDEQPSVSVRFPKRIIVFIDEHAKATGNDRSGVIRLFVYRELAMAGYLNENEMKALGVKNEEKEE